MDIGSGNGYPSSALSNFAPHEFELDGVKCASMEGFLQSLKFKSYLSGDPGYPEPMFLPFLVRPLSLAFAVILYAVDVNT